MERYWVWEYGLFEKNPKRVDSLNPETTLEVVKLADAQATVEALQKKYDDLLGKYHQLVDFYDKHNGTPCEQIRHQQQVDALQRVRDEFERERDQLHAALMEAKAALDAEREKVKDFEAAAGAMSCKEIADKVAGYTQLQALVRALLDTWVNGRKIHDGIPMTLRQQIDASLGATSQQLLKPSDFVKISS